MKSISFVWISSPPPKEGAYVTRRNQSKYETPRYWKDGGWYEIGHSSSRRGGIPVTVTRKEMSSLFAIYKPGTVYLRAINPSLGSIEWGISIQVFSPKETLDYLVKTGRLPTDWKTCFQEEMREMRNQLKIKDSK